MAFWFKTYKLLINLNIFILGESSSEYEPPADEPYETYMPEPVKTVKKRKKRYTKEEESIFWKYFQTDIQKGNMPRGEKIQKVAALLPGRTVPQIRTRINNYILGKQKI